MEVIELLRNVLMTYCVDTYRMSDLFAGDIIFDGGIRKQIFVEYDYRNLAEALSEVCKDKTVSIITDQLGVNYILVNIAERLGEDIGYMLIGPYLSINAVDINKIIQDLEIPLFYMSALKQYYYGIPVIENLEKIVCLFVENIIGKGRYEVFRAGLSTREEIFKGWEIRSEYEDEFQLSRVEKRYLQEEKLLEAIREGDVIKASFFMDNFGIYEVPNQTADTLQNYKNICLVLNTLFRKEVQKARVHPVHIDHVSNILAKRIGKARSGAELRDICKKMIRKYCILVQNYSLIGYSEVIEKIINYIDFHLQEPLGLQWIAKYFNLNASYLSRLFKKETGKTLTDYINEKRIEKSLIYLATTNLQIQEIAAQVGILDENYFSRMFKKIKHMTPREYRNRIQWEHK